MPKLLFLRRNHERSDKAKKEAAGSGVAHPRGRSAGHAHGLGLLQDARHQCPRNNSGRGHPQETRTVAHHGGHLSHHPEQPVRQQAHRRLQQSRKNHVQNGSRLFHRGYVLTN